MKIKIYSTPTCPHCRALKKYLDGKKIKYEDIDVTKNQKALKEMIKKSGQMGVPVIDIEGKIITGFDREKLEKLLKNGKRKI